MFFILLEDSVRVGDVVEIAGVGGLIEEVKLRTILLRDESGSIHVIPNGNINTVKNMTQLYPIMSSISASPTGRR